MRKAFLFVALVLAVAGCSRFKMEEATFVAYNASGDQAAFLVNDGTEHVVEANRSAQFTVEIPIPTQPVYGYTSPSASVDKTTQVSVAARNLTTGKLTRPTMCTAGAKVVVHITYEGRDYVSCQSSY